MSTFEVVWIRRLIVGPYPYDAGQIAITKSNQVYALECMDDGRRSYNPTLTQSTSARKMISHVARKELAMTSRKARRKALKKIGMEAFERAAKEVYIPAMIDERLQNQDPDAAKIGQVATIVWREVGASIQKEQRRRRRRKRS
jgi:hypothetical protein